MTIVTLAPLQHSRAPLREAIIGALRGAMETGELAPGARLVERDLCEQFCVSRTVLREALRELVTDGIVAEHGRRGLAVADVSVAEARAAYSIRGAIKALIVEQFIDRAGDAQRSELQVVTKALVCAYRSGQVDAILTSKRAFYACLCDGAENALAQGLIEKLCLKVSGPRSRALGRKERNTLSIQEIEHVVAAILQRDRQAARQAMVDHIDSVCSWALQTQGPDADPPTGDPTSEPAQTRTLLRRELSSISIADEGRHRASARTALSASTSRNRA